ncbi:hypothetical protein BS78_03G009500 [Paspalum vaginatum]|nr:hypothetical protein BS78_03G009500 [Paspalum vaginatum]
MYSLMMEDVNKLRIVAIDVGAMAVGTDVGATTMRGKTNTEIVWPQRINEQEPQGQIDFCPSLHIDLVQHASVGVPLTQHTSTHDGGKIGVELCSCSVKMDELCSCSSNMDAKYGDMAIGNEGGMAAEKEGNVAATGMEGNSGKEGDVVAGKKVVKPKARNLWRVDDRNMDLLRPNLTWEQVVVKVLHMIRC